MALKAVDSEVTGNGRFGYTRGGIHLLLVVAVVLVLLRIIQGRSPIA